jgi:hypothetical protein
MATRYILLGLGCVFLLAGLVRWAHHRRARGAARTWLLVGGLFVIVGLWLLYKG